MQMEVSTTEEVLAVMEVGARNRAVAETKMNERSSRSHSVLTIIVDGTNLASGERTHGCLHLIDLAGTRTALGPPLSLIAVDAFAHEEAAQEERACMAALTSTSSS